MSLGLLLTRPRLCFAAARCAVLTAARLNLFRSETARERERERNKKEGIRRIPVPSRSLYISPSLPLCSFKEDAPSQHLLCFVFSPSHRSWVDVAFRCLDAVCVVLFFFLEHDFGVQPGFPPSHRKSVNDFERHNVSKSAKDMCRVLASPLQHRKHRLAFLFFLSRRGEQNSWGLVES